MILGVTKLPSTVLVHPVHNIILYFRLDFFNEYMISFFQLFLDILSLVLAMCTLKDHEKKIVATNYSPTKAFHII